MERIKNKISEQADEVLDSGVTSSKDSMTAFFFRASSRTRRPIHMSEWEQYISEPLLHQDCNSLEWWKGKKSQYPILFKLAKSYLAVQATSAASERLFSTAGSILTKKRNRLNSELLDKLLFLNKTLNK